MKPDGYVYGYEFLPTDTGTSINFYPWPFYWRTGNCSTRPVAIRRGRGSGRTQRFNLKGAPGGRSWWRLPARC
jgi:hypothetical protein